VLHFQNGLQEAELRIISQLVRIRPRVMKKRWGIMGDDMMMKVLELMAIWFGMVVK
jgi:hypothetical protein